MHHRPASPPLTARVTGAFTRWGLLLRALLRVPAGRRLALAGVVTTAVTALVLGLPVVSGLGSAMQPLSLDSTSSTTTTPSAEEGSPVVMGVDGRPIASSSFAGAVPSTMSGETAEAAPGTTDPTEPTDSTDPTAVTSEPAGSPAPVAGGSSAPAAGPSTESSSRAPSTVPSSPGPSSGPAAPAAPAPDPSEPPASAPAPAQPEEPAEDDAEEELLELLDEARDDCAPLTPDGSLADAARAHSAAMRKVEALTPLEGGPAGSIAQGGTDAEDVLDDWLDDPTGRATILDCSRGSVGIGLVDGDGGPWWTLLLA